MRRRLDAELVRRGLARSRQHAAELITAGRVAIAGMPSEKAATQVAEAEPITVADAVGTEWVSRGGVKLAGALDVLAADQRSGPRIDGRRCLDAGASTGGFTDVLLRRGARSVVAVDVGYGQLAWSLRTDPRVLTIDRTNVRELTLDLIGGAVDLVVADLSFIPLPLVLPALHGVLAPASDMFVMVKPQFEVGRHALGKGGVVSDPNLRALAVRGVLQAAHGLGMGVRAVVASPLPGPAGNVEYFAWLSPGRGAPPQAWDDLIEQAIAAGPDSNARRNRVEIG